MINTIIIIGNLCRDAELKKTTNDTSVATFTLAFSTSKDNTSFVDVKTFGVVADNIVKYCRKGDKVCVNGYLTQRSYVAKDGNKKSVYEIIANNIEFIKTKNEEKVEEEKPSAPVVINQVKEGQMNDEDLPF